MEALQTMCADHLDGRITKCAHQHLARWKKRGTFRLHIVPEGGRAQTFIYKDEAYTIEEIPALSELPVLPGPPKYCVYSQSKDSTLSPFLPKLFWCAEIEPGRHFRYLLEDLGQTHRNLHFRAGDLLFAVRTLIGAHKAMKSSLADKNSRHLIRYDETYADKLTTYSLRSLEQYVGYTADADVEKIVKYWPRILEYRDENNIYTGDIKQSIHGDYTLAHIYYPRVDVQRHVKIVDWEWAGIGTPHVDLATVLKWADADVKAEAVRLFTREHNQLSGAEHERALRRCLLERKLLDAGFFARQHVVTKRKGQNASRYFRRTIADVLAIAEGA